jgi:hypothetical protein
MSVGSHSHGRPRAPHFCAMFNMHLTRTLLKASVAILLAMMCAVLPLSEWAPIWFIKIQLPATGIVLVCYLGKLLYDTLFYDRYHP